MTATSVQMGLLVKHMSGLVKGRVRAQATDVKMLLRLLPGRHEQKV
jgi:hypothetical protein